MSRLKTDDLVIFEELTDEEAKNTMGGTVAVAGQEDGTSWDAEDKNLFAWDGDDKNPFAREDDRTSNIEDGVID